MPAVCTQPNNIFFFTLCERRTDREMVLIGIAPAVATAWTSISEWTFVPVYTLKW